MSEMVRRVAAAIHDVPNVWRRVNKVRNDGFIYEIGYDHDAGAVVAEVYSDYTDAMSAQLRLQGAMHARAALAAMREPTPEMIRAGCSAATNIGAWRLMIDAALSDGMDLRQRASTQLPDCRVGPNGVEPRVHRKEMRARRQHWRSSNPDRASVLSRA
jgi:hypothetical protein